jgi:ubiquinone biosynthesis protein UbiJ
MSTTQERKRADLDSLAERGGEALHRLASERPVSDVVHVALGAKERIDGVLRTVLTQAGMAPADEVKRLRSEVARLEKRVQELEGEKKPAAARKRTAKADGP